MHTKYTAMLFEQVYAYADLISKNDSTVIKEPLGAKKKILHLNIGFLTRKCSVYK
jgi:hypothetical protein